MKREPRGLGEIGVWYVYFSLESKRRERKRISERKNDMNSSIRKKMEKWKRTIEEKFHSALCNNLLHVNLYNSVVCYLIWRLTIIHSKYLLINQHLLELRKVHIDPKWKIFDFGYGEKMIVLFIQFTFNF